MAILENEEGVGEQDIMIHRISHLKDLMYFATQYKWRSVLNFHAACLLEVERGNLKWGRSFQRLESTTLSNNYLPARNAKPAGRQSESNPGFAKEKVLFCNAYQKEACSHTKDHLGNFYGESRMLRHMCAKCWQRARTICNHPETSAECPEK